MTDLDEAVEEAKFRAEAFESIKRRHHHDDGTMVSLEKMDKEGIERKLIEEENLWKLRNQQAETQNLFEKESLPKQDIPQPEEHSSQESAKKKQIMAGCNCGKMFEVSENDDNFQITSFDSSGKVENSYVSTGNSDSNSYGSFGNADGETYSSSGGAPPSSGGYS